MPRGISTTHSEAASHVRDAASELHARPTRSALAQSIADASGRLLPVLGQHVVRTPLTPLIGPAGTHEMSVLIKSEHLQHTGSFKVRGATAKLLALTAAELEGGVITASSGNHGLGVAYALASLGARGTVYVPQGASEVKVAAIRRLGATVVEHGSVMDETEAHARATAGQAGLVYISPYNDEQVIAGQGTIALEILEQLDGAPLDAVYLAVGGGGLASGIGAVLRALSPRTRLIGVSPANDAAMAASVRAGRVVEPPTSPTLSDGTAGGIEPGAITLPLCAELIDEWVLVDEAQIRGALRQFIDVQHQLIEGAAAVPLAAALQQATARIGQRVAVVACGANISAARLRDALQP
ncbi:MAG TPA: threonine/serine dehydratase [Sporichthya sp.]|nr:threonine/serine dehydratase [Sporichthya sp.]